MDTAIFRVAQECMTNIQRYSGSPVAENSLVPRQARGLGGNWERATGFTI